MKPRRVCLYMLMVILFCSYLILDKILETPQLGTATPKNGTETQRKSRFMLYFNMHLKFYMGYHTCANSSRTPNLNYSISSDT